jgi:hypothetical protein
LGLLAKTPNAAKHPKSGQVTASRANSRVIFLMQTERLVLEESDRSAGVLMDRTREWGVEGGNGAAFLRR